MTNIALIISIIAQLFAIACLFYVRKQYKISRENWKKIAKLREESARLEAWRKNKDRSKIGIKYVKPGDKFVYDNNGYTYLAHDYAVYEPRLDAYIVDVSVNNETYHAESVFKANKSFILIEN